MDAAQAEIHAYEAPWKALCDFALHSDLDKMNMAGNPHYGQLVSQVRGREGGREGRAENNLWYRESAVRSPIRFPPDNGMTCFPQNQLKPCKMVIFGVIYKFCTNLLVVVVGRC